MLQHLLSFVFALGLTLSANAGELGKYSFPDGPNPKMTPGVLCTHPTAYRYAEHIPYCERDVSSSLKQQIIATYDSQFHYTIQKLPRVDFKIDHFIPLSVGGANEIGNLWPQHKSIYRYSDMIESYLSTLMVKGHIKQIEAIEAITTCKLHLEKCQGIEADLAKRL
ncbi:MAG: hypothetical protein H7Z71_02195 [Moraxellaceae bacterium]|nr:hypothetical protein [Pseudobdellovibrionaceae bacterium]